MALEKPENMEQCVYFTRRTLDPKGRVMAWVMKIKCEKCKKGLMAKPRDEKTGKPKIRAQEYVCAECGNSEDKIVHEDKLICCIEYECDSCDKVGETTAPFKRKSFEGVPAIVFVCEGCGKKIGITKKMKAPKKKKGKEDIATEDDDDF